MQTKTAAFRNILLTIALIIGLGACEKTEDELYALNHENGISSTSIIAFKPTSPSNTIADGVSQSALTIQLSPEADFVANPISLTTSRGTFSNGRQTDTITANASGTISFQVKSVTPGEAKVVAKVKNMTIDTTLVFDPALPQALSISLDKYVTDVSQSIEATTTLARDPFKGQVSDPVRVFYNIRPEAPQSDSLIYPSFALSDGGKATITISNPFAITGRFRIEAKTVGHNGDTLRKETYFKIQ